MKTIVEIFILAIFGLAISMVLIGTFSEISNISREAMNYGSLILGMSLGFGSRIYVLNEDIDGMNRIKEFQDKVIDKLLKDEEYHRG